MNRFSFPRWLGWYGALVLLLTASGGTACRSLDTSSGRSGKLALIVAIGEQGHPDTGKPYPRLTGPENDVDLIGAALRYHGFRDDDITVLRDADATKRGIVEAFEKVLIARARPGDIVVFHYSGHGHQVTDDSADEVDGYDEVLVPYGAPDLSSFPDSVQAAYDGGDHIRDDLLGSLLARLQAKVGEEGDIAVFLDACYSGTGTRGPGGLVARGGEVPIGPPAVGQRMVARSGFADGGGGRGPIGIGGSSGSAGYVVTTAASDRQRAWEVYHVDGETVVGSLTHALAVTLPRMRPGSTYRDLHAMITAVMRDKGLPQTPQIEGPGDAELFKRLVADSDEWVSVRSVERDGGLVLSAGHLRGLATDAQVEVHRADAIDPGDPSTLWARGVVTRSTPLRSFVQLLDQPPGNANLERGRVYVTRESFGDFSTEIRIGRTLDESVAPYVRDALKAHAIVSLVTEGGAAVVEQEDGVVVLNIADNNDPVGPAIVIRNEQDARTFADAVVAYARSRYLRNLAPNDPGIDVSLRLLPATSSRRRGCTPARADTSRFEHATRLGGEDQEWEIRPSANEVFILKVTNYRESTPYITIVDILPNGDVKQLYPREGTRRLTPLQDHTVPMCFAVDPVSGVEVIKLFATREPVNFRPLLAAGQRPLSPAAAERPHDVDSQWPENQMFPGREAANDWSDMVSVSSVRIHVKADEDRKSTIAKRQ